MGERSGIEEWSASWPSLVLAEQRSVHVRNESHAKGIGMLIGELLTAVGGLALFALLAARFGANSRDEITDPPQPPLGSFRGASARRRRA